MNYVDRLFVAVQSGAILPGKIGHAFIEHDDDCAGWMGFACSCEPDVFIDTANGRVYVLPDGTVARGEDARS